MTGEPLFFVHVMKTGGTSVSRAIVQALGPESATYPFGEREFKHAAKVDPSMLLELARGHAFEFVSVHMPAWTAAAVAPAGIHCSVLRDPVGRTISHLHHVQRSIAAHGFDRSIEELYDDPHLRTLLANYQVWIFASPRPDVTPDPIDGEALVREARALAADDPRAAPPKWLYNVATCRSDDTAQNERDLSAARQVMESFHAIGITPDLERFGETVSRLSGLRLRVEHGNKTERSSDCPEGLRRRIAEDNQLEADLYETALELSRRAP